MMANISILLASPEIMHLCSHHWATVGFSLSTFHKHPNLGLISPWLKLY